MMLALKIMDVWYRINPNRLIIGDCILTTLFVAAIAQIYAKRGI